MHKYDNRQIILGGANATISNCNCSPECQRPLVRRDDGQKDAMTALAEAVLLVMEYNLDDPGHPEYLVEQEREFIIDLLHLQLEHFMEILGEIRPILFEGAIEVIHHFASQPNDNRYLPGTQFGSN